MNFLLIVSCLGLLLGNVVTVSVDCPLYNNCVVSGGVVILSNMTKVTSFTVIDAKFDEKPIFFTDFDQLKTLNINNSSFSSEEVFNLAMQSLIKFQSHIKVLDLSHNKGIEVIRRGTFITEGNVSYLFTLNLSHNQINLIENGAFSVFESLEELNLAYNRLEKLNGSLTDRPLFNLKVLRLDNNEINELSDDTFKGLYNLDELWMNSNQIVTLSAAILKPLKNLRVLDVSRNDLNSIEILSPKLKILNVAINRLEIKEIKGLDRLTYLKSLNISHNPVGQVINETFMRLISLEELKMCSGSLKLTDNDIFKPLVNLKYLDIRDNVLKDTDMTQFGVLGKLILIQLDGNGLSRLEIRDFPSTLRYIGLQNNSFSCDYLQDMLKNLRNRGVRLYFTSEIPSILSKNYVQGIQCLPEHLENCSSDYLQQYFYTWHTKLSSLVCLVLALIYILILWRNKEAIRRIKDEEYEEEELLDDEERNSPTDPSKTLLRQEATVVVDGVPLNHYMEDMLTKSISFNAGKGRQGLEWVINRINTEVNELATSAAKSTGELFTHTRKLIDDTTDSARKSMDELSAQTQKIRF